MKLTIDWLIEHLETTATTHDIINALEALGLPCEKIYKAHDSWAQIEIVRITSKEKHPNADKLSLYDIQLANGQTRKLVCGDQSLEIGMFVPYARDGVFAPGLGITLKVATIRGIDSPGMLCSANDLCLPLEGNGVIRCHKHHFGSSISNAFESQAIIEIEVTPNRGDVLSIRGIARALSHHGLGKLKPLITAKQKYTNTNELAKIESADCQALAVAVVEHTAAPTNALIATRLRLTGHNPTGIDIIDLTNYVAHELGQPMHAFDNAKLSGLLKIKNTTRQEQYEALTGEKLTLDSGTLVIEDSQKIVSWPGVVGSMNSKTEMTTSKVLLETGVFKIDSMQRRRNKIITSAAKKFECGVDPCNLENTIDRYCYLLGKEAIKAESHSFTLVSKIKFDLSYIKKILGINVTLEQLRAKLEPRGFIISDTLEITVPSYKFFDIHSPNCIVEEYATGHYDEIESINLAPQSYNTRSKNQHTLANSALENGFEQVYNFTLTNATNLAFTDKQPVTTTIKNSTNANYSVLRVSMIPQLLKIANWHGNNSHPYTDFFEIGTVYDDNGQRTILSALSDTPDKLLRIFYHFLENNDYNAPMISNTLPSWQDSGVSFIQNGKIIATCGRIKQKLVRNEIGENTTYYALEIYANETSGLTHKSYPKPTIAPVYKDISFILPINTKAHVLTDFLNEQNYDYTVFDIYPSNLLNVQRNFGVRFKFVFDESVTKNELNDKIDQIKDAVREKLGIYSG